MANSEIEAIRTMLALRPRPPGLAERRARLDSFGTQYPLAGDVQVERADANGVSAEWTTAPGADSSRVMLFLHGGGYVSGSLDSHLHVVAQTGREAGVRTLALDYRLAPEHPYPAALDDALAGYRFLLDQGIGPGHIAVAGESAGGGLAIATLVVARDAGLPLPGCVWCSSPWGDLAMTGGTMATKAAADPMIQRAYLQELADAYLNGADPLLPLVSRFMPICADCRRRCSRSDQPRLCSTIRSGWQGRRAPPTSVSRWRCGPT